MVEYIKRKEKEGHLKTKTTFTKERKMGPSQPSEDAAVYDVEKKKSNKYASVNRHLISKLKGSV